MRQVHGVYTALVTPFTEDGQIDEAGLRTNIGIMMDNRIDGLVPLGTTGEAPTLSSAEKRRIIELTVKEANGKIPVMVGTGTYSTQQTIENTVLAANLGANFALIVTPYYNKPTQEGLYLHFKAIAEASPIPIIVYNIQGRTGQNMQTDTLRRLADLQNIIGVKEASGNISQIGDVIEMIARHKPEFSVMSGDDNNTISVMALGGHGVISVASNLIPKQVKSLVKAMEMGEYDLARNIHYKLNTFFRGLFIETNPIPIKTMMNSWGLPAGGFRMPLCEPSTESKKKLDEILTTMEQLEGSMLAYHH